jgi:hypothetical protein
MTWKRPDWWVADEIHCVRSGGGPMIEGRCSEVSMEMIRCPRCAKEIPDVSRFCRRCGSAIAWRPAVPPAVIPALPQWGNQARTLTPPRPARRAPAAVTSGQKTGGGSGAGAFAILAAVGMVCFVNHQVRRAVLLPPTPNTVRYQSPALPALPAPPRPPRVSPPVSYPIPLRSNTPGAVRPPVPPSPPGSVIVIQPPTAPWPWDADEREPSARGERTGTRESTAPNRYDRRPASR